MLLFPICQNTDAEIKFQLNRLQTPLSSELKISSILLSHPYYHPLLPKLKAISAVLPIAKPNARSHKPAAPPILPEHNNLHQLRQSKNQLILKYLKYIPVPVYSYA